MNLRMAGREVGVLSCQQYMLFCTVTSFKAVGRGGQEGMGHFFLCFLLTPSGRGSSYWEPSWSRSPPIGG